MPSSLTRPLPSGFAVHRRQEAGVDVIAVDGDLDVFTTRWLRAELEEAIWRCRGPVVVDLTETGSVDTHTLAALLNAARRLARRDRELTIVCPSAGARRAFDVTGVSRQLTIVDAMPA